MLVIAVVLGSDNKPAKIRVSHEDDISVDSIRHVEDLWISQSDLKELLENRKVIHENGAWYFGGVGWLPVVDRIDNIIKDGVSLYWDGNRKQWSAYDARGRSKVYSASQLIECLTKDTKHRLFCNCDYAALPNIVTYGYEYLEYSILGTSLSQDIRDAMVLLSDAAFYDRGKIGLCNNFFQQSAVIIPDTWTSVKTSTIASDTLEVLTFPRKMCYLDLRLWRIPNLRSLVLPESIIGTTSKDYLTLMLVNSKHLEELVLPANVTAGCLIKLQSCSALRVIRTHPSQKGIITSDVSLHINNCPKLQVIDTPCYFYSGIDVDASCKLQKICCQSGSFLYGRVDFKSEVIPEICGIRS